MLPFLVIFFQCIQHYLQMFFIAQEVGIGSIYEKGLDVVLPYVMRISLLNVEQVFIRNVLLIRAVALADVLLQLAYRRVQVDH